MAGGRVVIVPGVDGFRATPASNYGTAAPGGAAGGPAGSSSMVFFVVVYPYNIRDTTLHEYFARSNGTNAGWRMFQNSGNMQCSVYNSTPAAVTVTVLGGLSALEGSHTPYLLLASYQNGVLTLWLNGVLGGTTTLGAGFSSYNGPTTLGVRSSVASQYAISEVLSDHGLLDAYDVAAYVDPIFGNGGPGLSARWNADLREGRYFTWPRVGALNSDWYWAARDAVVGPGTLVTWTDRFSATAMTKLGQPQGASFPARMM